MQTILLTTSHTSLEMGSVADWVSGIISTISLLMLVISTIRKNKPNLNFELMKETNIKIVESENKTNANYYLLVQNEEQHSINLKMKFKNDLNYNGRLIKLPSIDNHSDDKPVFFEIPIKEINKNNRIVFQSMVTKRKIAIYVETHNGEIMFYRGIFGIRQKVNKNLNRDNLTILK